MKVVGCNVNYMLNYVVSFVLDGKCVLVVFDNYLDMGLFGE